MENTEPTAPKPVDPTGPKPSEPTGLKAPIPPTVRLGRENANTAPRPKVSIPKLAMLFGCFVLYTACVIVGTIRYYEYKHPPARPPASTTSSLIRVQMPDGTSRYMTPEEFNEFKRSGGAEHATIEVIPRPPSLTPKEPTTPAQPTETFELPGVPDLKTVREQSRKPVKDLGVKRDTPTTSTPDRASDSPQKDVTLPTQPPTPPAAIKTAPAAVQDPAAQAKILRTRIQVYTSEVERLEKNMELIPDTPENSDMREKFKRKADAARRNLQDAQAQLNALGVADKGDTQPKTE